MPIHYLIIYINLVLLIVSFISLVILLSADPFRLNQAA